VNFSKLLLLLPLTVLGISGCAHVTSGERVAAERYLKSSCLEAFLSSRTTVSSDGFGYQYWRYQPRAFAVANYGDQQVCGWYRGAAGANRNSINEEAIQACNKYLPPGLVCGLFAVDDSIVGIPTSHSIQQAPIENIQKPSPPSPSSTSQQLGIDKAKVKCADLGFKLGTEGFGKCVLKLSN
jgi:hypothetical protein